MSPKKPKRVALYLRVSTSEQTTRNQRRELHAVAERHGWHVVASMKTQVSQVPRVVTSVRGLIA
jgi:DNA invertase Pin-like site-specific DNA recombinase